MVPKPVGPYSLFKFAGDVVFLSGQIGDFSRQDIVEQTKSALENVKSVLSSIKLDLKDVIKATIFTTQIERFSDINAVWEEFFGEVLPARSTVGVYSLPKGALIEIEVIAYLGRPQALFYAGCYHFLKDDFLSAHEYFEKAWKRDKRNLYQGFAILSAFCMNISHKKFPENLLKKALEKISKDNDIDLEAFLEWKRKILEPGKSDVLDVLKDFVRTISSISR